CRRRHKGIVCEYHRIIDKERAVCIPFYKIANVIREDIRAVAVGVPRQILPILCDQGIGVPFAFSRGMGQLPKTVFVESEMMGAAEISARRISSYSVQLPFSGNAGGVTRVFQEVAEGGFPGIQVAEIFVVPK